VKLMPSHDSLFLLRNVLAALRLMYLLRTAPCCESSELPMYDVGFRDFLSATLNIDINDHKVDTSVAASPSGWPGSPIYCSTDTICLFGFRRKHGPHIQSTSGRVMWRCWQRNRHCYDCLVTTGRFVAKLYSCCTHIDHRDSTLLGRPV